MEAAAGFTLLLSGSDVIDFANLEVWKELETHIPARYIKGNFFKQDTVELTHRGAKIQLRVTYFSPTKRYYTELFVRLPSRADFNFEIKPKSILSGFPRLFGIQPIQVGDPEIDNQFVVTGSDAGRMRQLFREKHFCRIVAANLDMTLSLSNGQYLQFTAPDIIRDLNRLCFLFQLFMEIIDFVIDSTGAAMVPMEQ